MQQYDPARQNYSWEDACGHVSTVLPDLFSLQDLVNAQNWGCGPKWLEAIIVEVTGPVSYIVLTSGDLRLGRRIDQVQNIDGPCNPLGSDVGLSPGVKVSQQAKDSPKAPVSERKSLQMPVFPWKHQRGSEVNPRVHVGLQKVQ
ncbi:hypothetical protein PR048_022197 [Dryococelus australis]|uniref:Uncharacterized protein n=1 Tax=Dryococelus australis TaxID=614101 RepID=A0ABQ9H0D9_9NEOP|nr:hypothetical protein PR048_022197 [Dryococelus australis]